MANYGGSPWGRVEDRDVVIENSVRSVSTAGHGGLMITQEWAKQHLSKAAITVGLRYDGCLGYEEDCDWAIPCYESPELLEAYRASLYNPVILTKDYCLGIIKRYCVKYCRLAKIEPDPEAVEYM